MPYRSISGFHANGFSRGTSGVVKVQFAILLPDPKKKGRAPEGPPSQLLLRVRTNRRGGLSNDQSLWTVESPASFTVPAQRLEAGQLVNDRTTDGVELLSASLSESLLTRVVLG